MLLATVQYCDLILYIVRVDLLSLIMNSNRFLVISLGFSVSCYLQREIVLPSFPSLVPFIYLSCLIAVARTYSTTLNRSVKS